MGVFVLVAYLYCLFMLPAIYVAFQIFSLFFFEPFLVTSAVAHTRGSRDTNYDIVLSP